MSLKRNVQTESAESKYQEGDVFPASPYFPGFKNPVFKYKEGSKPIWLDPEREVEANMNKDQLRDLITRVLKEANLYSESAVELLMLTAATESNLGEYIRQVRGPALGIFQMEPATHKDIWKNYLSYKDWARWTYEASVDDLETDLRYAILMTRIHYLRVPDPLPPADDVEGLAAYWKDHYNTYLGAGTVEKAVEKYKQYAV